MTTQLPQHADVPMSLAAFPPSDQSVSDDATDTPLQDPASTPLDYASADPTLATLEPTGAASEFGLLKDCKPHEKERWERQEQYLAAFIRQGAHVRTCQSTGISRHTAIYWEEHNIYGFRERLKLAQQAHTERWESLMDKRLEDPQGNRGSDVLLMFKLKALDPQKYRELPVSDHGALAQGLSVLMQLGRMSQGAAPQLQAPSTDATVRDLQADTDTPR